MTFAYYYFFLLTVLCMLHKTLNMLYYVLYVIENTTIF